MDRNYFGITDTGRIRDNNEDTFIAEKIKGNNCVIACVVDGVGGYAGGEIASAIAKRSILDYLNRPNADYPALMKDAIIAADEEIRAEKVKSADHEKMACVLTLAVADLERNLFWYAHVGDTRLYLLRDQSLIKISKDQSFVGFMEDSGRLTEEEAMRHPKRNEINKALGFGAGVAAQSDYIETGQSPFLPGDLLLVCSDGLSDMVNKRQMTDILNSQASLQQKGEALVQAANMNGGLDNITVVLVRNDKKSSLHEPAKPAAKIRTASTHAKRAAVEPPPEQTAAPVQQKNSNKGWLIFLSLLCLILAGGIVYLLRQAHLTEISTSAGQKLSTIKPPRNPQEKKLQGLIDSLDENLLIISDSIFTSPILITEPLRVNRDTLYLIADKEIVFQADSSFKGIPINVLPANRHLRLENFAFQDFKTAISTQSNALVLKNVRFINTPDAIQSIIRFPQGTYVNGKIPQSILTTDSLPVTIE